MAPVAHGHGHRSRRPRRKSRATPTAPTPRVPPVSEALCSLSSASVPLQGLQLRLLAFFPVRFQNSNPLSSSSSIAVSLFATGEEREGDRGRDLEAAAWQASKFGEESIEKSARVGGGDSSLRARQASEAPPSLFTSSFPASLFDFVVYLLTGEPPLLARFASCSLF